MRYSMGLLTLFAATLSHGHAHRADSPRRRGVEPRHVGRHHQSGVLRGRRGESVQRADGQPRVDARRELHVARRVPADHRRDGPRQIAHRVQRRGRAADRGRARRHGPRSAAVRVRDRAAHARVRRRRDRSRAPPRGRDPQHQRQRVSGLRRADGGGQRRRVHHGRSALQRDPSAARRSARAHGRLRAAQRRSDRGGAGDRDLRSARTLRGRPHHGPRERRGSGGGAARARLRRHHGRLPRSDADAHADQLPLRLAARPFDDAVARGDAASAA